MHTAASLMAVDKIPKERKEANYIQNILPGTKEMTLIPAATSQVPKDHDMHILTMGNSPKLTPRQTAPQSRPETAHVKKKIQSKHYAKSMSFSPLSSCGFTCFSTKKFINKLLPLCRKCPQVELLLRPWDLSAILCSHAAFQGSFSSPNTSSCMPWKRL